MVANGDKLSYCVIDTKVVLREAEGITARRRYYECEHQRQGLSVGWGDTYESHLDGQSLDLSGIADGYYALTSQANPDGILLERNYANNTALLYLKIQRSHVLLVPPGEIIMLHCLANDWC